MHSIGLGIADRGRRRKKSGAPTNLCGVNQAESCDLVEVMTALILRCTHHSANLPTSYQPPDTTSDCTSTVFTWHSVCHCALDLLLG